MGNGGAGLILGESQEFKLHNVLVACNLLLVKLCVAKAPAAMLARAIRAIFKSGLASETGTRETLARGKSDSVLNRESIAIKLAGFVVYLVKDFSIRANNTVTSVDLLLRDRSQQSLKC